MVYGPAYPREKLLTQISIIMNQSDFKIGQKIYDVGVNVLTLIPEIQEHTILCVGSKSVYAQGIDVLFHNETETIFLFSSMDVFRPEDLMKSFIHTVWTNDLDKARKYCSKMLEVLEFRNNLKKVG